MAGPAAVEPLQAARLMNELMSSSLFSSARVAPAALAVGVSDLESEICDLKFPCLSSVEAKDDCSPSH
jgi:hypothetical protein